MPRNGRNANLASLAILGPTTMALLRATLNVLLAASAVALPLAPGTPEPSLSLAASDDVAMHRHAENANGTVHQRNDDKPMCRKAWPHGTVHAGSPLIALYEHMILTHAMVAAHFGRQRIIEVGRGLL